MQRGQPAALTVYVTTAAEAAELDRRTIAGGVPSKELMQRAGSAAARLLRTEDSDRLAHGVYVATGPGNNGGDGWVVAGALAAEGIPVRVNEVIESRSDDARAARAHATGSIGRSAGWNGERVVVDALLGTGSGGEPRGAIAAQIAAINDAREQGATVVALDLPTGVDATEGASGASIVADVTVTFGTIKRGHLNSRDRCGRIMVMDIGLAGPEPGVLLPELVTPAQAYGWVPPIPVTAHKGSRGGVSIIGGGAGMAGAAILSARGALRAGAGSARICVSDENTSVAHTAVPAALVTPWSRVLADVPKHLGEWPEAIACGPGFGTDSDASRLLDALLATWAGPLVLDADALNLLIGRIDELRDRLRAKSDSCRAVLTPHHAEMKRLIGGGMSSSDASDARYDVSLWLAQRTGAVVLFKGTPTVIAAPDGRRRVAARGTAALATGGSGDVLAGIIATLLAQGVEGFDAAAVGAWMHGRAGELATGDRTPRGVTIDDVVEALRDVWALPLAEPAAGVLAELPALQ